ncbi:hypothetical protein V6N12_066081 [Hibiscus sabdariffa]|uniref:Uncharacterized protein n=1 Tax=Hibiscus sabdariffa TaxID=183260 RepID=A0ABR2AQF3_9ROSI
MSYTMGHTLPLVAILSFLGAFVWTFLEYCFHRFLLHLDTKNYWILFSVSIGSVLLEGELTGYVIYDTTHYYLHQPHS